MLETPADADPGRGPVVMLVDDNGPMRALIRSLVQEVATVIHEYEDGQTALDAYPTIRPDLVLMDIELVGIDGIATTRAIHLLDPDATVVIVTGHGGDDYRRAATAAGAAAFVLKEDLLELSALVATLHRDTSHRRTRST